MAKVAENGSDDESGHVRLLVRRMLDGELSPPADSGT